MSGRPDNWTGHLRWPKHVPRPNTGMHSGWLINACCIIISSNMRAILRVSKSHSGNKSKQPRWTHTCTHTHVHTPTPTRTNARTRTHRGLYMYARMHTHTRTKGSAGIYKNINKCPLAIYKLLYSKWVYVYPVTSLAWEREQLGDNL